MTTELFLRLAVDPALALLPEAMGTPSARALLVAIALQESDLQARRQHFGPARSYFQFETGGIAGVLTHPASRSIATRVCEALDVAPNIQSVYAAIEYHDVLAVVCARCLLWTSPLALPDRTSSPAAWRLYTATWRPGTPRPDAWGANFSGAWSHVDQGVHA